MRNAAVFYLNGQRHEVGGELAGLMLSDYLRYRAGLTGTKVVCAEGDCGACTILRSFPLQSGARKTKGSPRFLAMNSCIATVAQMDGSNLISVDALSGASGPTPVQEAMVKCHGSQCGFCTPGFVMALTGAIEKRLCDGAADGRLSNEEAKNALTGNLCRCTGYQQIIEAATSIEIKKYDSVALRFKSRENVRELAAVVKKPLHISSDEFEFFAPLSLKEAARFLARQRDARVLGAATDLGVFHNKRRRRLDQVVSLHLISSLYELGLEKAKGRSPRARVGARVTLAELRSFLKANSPETAKYLDIFASPQIKNVATLIGNVANASPIADTPAFLMVADAIVNVVGVKGRRAIAIEKFFVGYRKTALARGELIESIEFDLPETRARRDAFAVYKISERKDLDISSVNAGFRLKFASTGQGQRITEAKIAYGGVAAVPLRLRKTEKFLVGSAITGNSIEETIEQAALLLQSEIAPIADVRGSSAFRRIQAENLMRRFFRSLERER